ncbi:MAG TPA: ABC transporter ATP-binding protein [Mycobacteriales bacterium]|jgi:branched-chain amino acid transport system ATP-binding protein|nr:ABC transporter ATP-binding protein [Mycobacteriales bacterium]
MVHTEVAMIATTPLLALHDVSLVFGGVHALRDVSFAVADGTICGLVGPNGAGKTSLFNCICGFYLPTAGRIELRGRPITRRAPHSLAALGIARTFQHPVLQRDRTVLDNVLVGGHSTVAAGPVRYALRLGVRRAERDLADRARELLGYLGIDGLAALPAGRLSYGQQKRVELARALMSRPALLLLDELASGLTHSEVLDLAEQIRRIRADRDVSIVLVEHHMGMVAAVTDTVVALVQGEKVAEGSAAEVQRHPVVVEAYLGGGAAA